MHLAPGCTLGTRGPLCDSVALPGTLAGLAVLTVGVHAVGSCPPSCAWGAQGLVCGGSWGRPLSYSWREAGGASHRKPSLMPVPRQRPPSRHVPDRPGSLGSGESSGCAAWLSLAGPGLDYPPVPSTVEAVWVGHPLGRAL